MSIQDFTDSNYREEVLDYKGYTLVDFWAPWCGPCQQLGPIIEQYAIDVDGKVKVGKMNVDESPETPTKYGIRSIPALVLLKDGQPIATKVGALSKIALTNWIEAEIK